MKMRIKNSHSGPISIKTLLKFLVLQLVLGLLNTDLSGQNPNLDPSFGTNGYHVMEQNFTMEAAYFALADDGAMFTLTNEIDSANSMFVVVARKFTNSGAQALSFNGTGKVVLAGFGESWINSAFLMPDSSGGVYIAAFGAKSAPFRRYNQLYHFNANGSLDANFGSSGVVVLSDSLGKLKLFNIQNDGTLRVIVELPGSNSNMLETIQFLPNGSVDTNFGTNGRDTVIVYNGSAEIIDLKKQADGKIFGLVRTFLPNGYYDKVFLFRLDLVGNLDNSFGSGGISEFQNTPEIENLSIQDFVQLPNGKYIVLVRSYFSFALVRYDANGNLDPSFGNDGRRLYSALPMLLPGKLAAQPDGKIILGGLFKKYLSPSTPGNYPNIGIGRLDEDGEFDLQFGTYGVSYFRSVSGNNDPVVYGMALQPDGKILVLGSASIYASIFNSLIIARFLNTNTVAIFEESDLQLKAQIFPNPVHAQASLAIELERPTMLNIRLSDQFGRELQHLENVKIASGTHQIQLSDVESLAAGIYFVTIASKVNSERTVLKMVKQ